MSVSVADQYNEIRSSIKRLCQDFPGEYWQRLDHEYGVSVKNANYCEVTWRLRVVFLH
jgi:hypothetical protein